MNDIKFQHCFQIRIMGTLMQGGQYGHGSIKVSTSIYIPVKSFQQYP